MQAIQKNSKETKIVETEPKTAAIADLNALQFAIADVMSGVDNDPEIEITESLMRQILRGQRSAYVTYHGVKLFVEGTRDDIKMQENMTPNDLVAMKSQQEKAK
jgi:antitoxin component HigA of HigAB toxin-antitoxin module